MPKIVPRVIFELGPDAPQLASEKGMQVPLTLHGELLVLSSYRDAAARSDVQEHQHLNLQALTWLKRNTSKQQARPK